MVEEVLMGRTLSQASPICLAGSNLLFCGCENPLDSIGSARFKLTLAAQSECLDESLDAIFKKTISPKLNLEGENDFTARPALMAELKTMPFGAAWDYYCLKKNAPVGEAWFADVKRYEREILLKR